MRPYQTLDLDRLTELLSYSKRTGRLTWKQGRRGGAKRGDDAGCLDSKGLVIITIDRKVYPAGRLAWALATKQWPSGRIRYRNNDSQDLRFENLYDEAHEPSPSKAAGYLRTYRRDMRELERRIRSDPMLKYDYDCDPEGTHARVREQIRFERQQKEVGAERRRNSEFKARYLARLDNEQADRARQAREERALYLKLKAKFEAEEATE